MAQNEHTVRIRDLVYRVTETDAVLIHWNKTRATLELPNAVEGKPVRDIDPEGFDGCDRLRDLSLPAEMEHLPLPELRQIKSLEAIRISPYHRDFCSCDGILYNKDQSELVDCPPARKAPVTIPETVRSIRKTAFLDCTELTEISLPPSLEVIGDRAFAGCRRLRRLDLPDTLYHIGKHALTRCRNLISLHLPPQIEEPPALWGCKALRKITVAPDNPALCSRDGVLYSADCKTLFFCPDAKEGVLHLPAETDEIAPGALSGCGLLTGIFAEPDSPCFSSSAGILYNSGGTELLCVPAAYSGTLQIPKTVTTVRPEAFPLRMLPILLSENGSTSHFWIEGSALEAIVTDPENSRFSDADGMLFNKEQTVLLRCPPGKSGAVTVPETVTQISDEAFRGCSSLSDIRLPSGLAEIGRSAFEGCFQLTHIVIPESVQEIGENAFVGCVRLEHAFIRGRDTVPGKLAFDCCDKLLLHAPHGSRTADYAQEEQIPFQEMTFQ